MKMPSRNPKAAKTKPNMDGAGNRLKRRVDSGNKKLARLFKDARLKKGLSLENLAMEAGGMEVMELEAIESGNSPIPMDHIYCLSNALDIDPQEVIFIVYDTLK